MTNTVILVLSLHFLCASTLLQHEKQTLVLISFDGFRHDYIERENLKHFKELAKDGVKAKSLQSSFVTKTFPNHFSIVTGLYEESHGIVSNYMYDPEYKEYFHPKATEYDPKWWNAATPIWILNELQFMKESKKQRKSATIFWPGSETSYQGHWPYFAFKNYSSNFTTRQRFDKILHLLTEEDPVNFIACYIEDPDKTSHRFGPDSKETSQVLQQLDKLLGYFIKQLKEYGLYNKVNIMLVSDHGMANVSSNNVITLTDYVDANDYDLVNYGTFLMIRPKKGKTKALYSKLKNISHLNTYYKEEIPEKWHYKNNRRVTKIFAVADEGYYVAPGNKKVHIPKGDHGYDNKLMSMHGIFLAQGPAFKKDLQIDMVKNIDLCSLMCHILYIIPDPNNGTLEHLKHIVAEHTLNEVIRKSPALIITLLSVSGIFIIVVVLGCTISCYRNMKKSALNKLDEETIPFAQWASEDDIVEFKRFER